MGVGAYSRPGACSRWALIQGWALIRINTVTGKDYGTITKSTCQSTLVLLISKRFLSFACEPIRI